MSRKRKRKADVFSGRVSPPRQKSEPRSLNGGEEGNRFDGDSYMGRENSYTPSAIWETPQTWVEYALGESEESRTFLAGTTVDPQLPTRRLCESGVSGFDHRPRRVDVGRYTPRR